MSQHQSYCPLDEVVTDFLDEAQLSNNQYSRIWHIAYRGFEDLGIDAFYQIKSVKLPINDNLTVTLPADFKNWSKVGVLNDRGEIIPLNFNDKLTKYQDLQPTRLEQTQDDTLASWNYQYTWYNYWNGWGYTNIYGVPSGQPFVGSFNIDNTNGVILLDEGYRYDYLMLEYVASPTPGGEYYLPQQFREALISWIRWKSVQSIPVKSRPEQSSVEAKRRDYYNDRRLAIARWKPIRVSEAYQSSQEFTRQTVRI